MPAQFSLSNQTLSLMGVINFDNAEKVYQEGLALLKQVVAPVVLLDLSAFNSSNTISLAVFVQWQRVIVEKSQFKLIHVPEKMRDIIEASNLLEAFALAA